VSEIRLRDVTLADADMLEAWADSPEAQGEFNDFGTPPDPAQRADVREALTRGPLRNERNGQMIIERLSDGAPIGTVGWHGVSYGPGPGSRAWNIGISLLPEARGHGYGPDAQRQLADWLFANTDANRVEAQTDVQNVAEQRALEKAGFVREGVARQSQFRAGGYHDLITFARLRDDP
jgi:RimJ/RimL family protein N-acetyltransferase